MRQNSLPIDNTGTDHNPLSNFAWIGGGGIKGGQVIGASDFQTSTEVLSKVHASLDPTSLKVMGRPFDFSTMRPRTDLPTSYDVKDYLNFASVINTIYQMFNVPKSRYRKLDRFGSVAPVLSGLI
jgi:hypothetical protein